jgi:putative MATE family efflux protein
MKIKADSLAKNVAAKRDWTSGSLLLNLWLLSWPTLIVNTINALGPTVDMFWVAKLGSADIAGVGVSGLVIMVVNSLISGLFMGTVALIARFIGAKDEKTANLAAQQAFVVGLVFSFLMALMGIFLAEPLLKLLGVAPNVVSEGAVYLRIQLIGIVTMTALQIAQSIMQASGDAMNPLKISVGYRLLQVILCPALIFGWSIFPHLGVSGAALSNVITQGLGGAIALWILFTGRTRIAVTFRNFRVDWSMIWRAVKIGIPASIAFMQRSFAELILIWFITPFGTIAVAAQSLAQRIDQFIQNLSGGIGTAGGVLAGQNLGAGKPDRAEKTGWLAVGIATIISITCSLIIWLWVVPILHIFNSEADLVNMAATFLRIQIVSYLVWGVVISLNMVINGVGDTFIGMVTNIVTTLGIQLGLAWYLPHATSLGVYGIRWAVVAGIVVRAVVYAVYFKSGRWKHKRV